MNNIKTAEDEKFIYRSDGVVISKRTQKRTGYIGGKGHYFYLACLINGKWTARFLHRKLYEAFNGKIPDGLTINHIDGNKRNNSLENLECLTIAENVRHAREVLGICSGKKKRLIKDDCVVLSIISSPRDKRNDLAKSYGVRADIACNIRSGKYKEFIPYIEADKIYRELSKNHRTRCKTQSCISRYFDEMQEVTRRSKL